jgi:hypothetical protein
MWCRECDGILYWWLWQQVCYFLSIKLFLTLLLALTNHDHWP